MYLDNKLFESYINQVFAYLEEKLKIFSKPQQAYIGAFIVSSASIPVFLIIMLFNIKNVKILDTLSAFSAGALVGDVFMHNLPEIYEESDHNHSSHKENFFTKKETLLGLGLISLFALEKIIKLFYKMNKKNKSQIKGKLIK